MDEADALEIAALRAESQPLSNAKFRNSCPQIGVDAKQSATSELVWMQINNCEEMRMAQRSAEQAERQALCAVLQDTVRAAVSENERIRKFFLQRAAVERTYAQQLDLGTWVMSGR